MIEAGACLHTINAFGTVVVEIFAALGLCAVLGALTWLGILVVQARPSST